MNKKVILMILDGWGIAKDKSVSAIDAANTPFVDSLFTKYPHNTLEASGVDMLRAIAIFLGLDENYFDAKVRRESFEPVDLFYAHVGGMDAFARGLKIANAIIEDGRLADFVKTRYGTYDSGIGAQIEKGEVSFEDLENYTLNNGEPTITSGRQEMLENLINDFI